MTEKEMIEIEQEEELDFEDRSDENSILPDEIPKEERKLQTQAYDKSISDVVAMMESGDIILNPHYQRNYVWDNRKASLLIESILLNVPIPVIYLDEDEESRWNVVDGLQRLYSLRRFFKNEFNLGGLEVLQELNKMKYCDLNPKAQRILRNGILRIILIFKESHHEIKYDIFMRLNRGAIKLNEQELRNCLYRGNFNELLKELRENQKFLRMIGLSQPHKRMIDAEIVLRYFTISDSYDIKERKLNNYSGQIKNSLNKYMKANINISNERSTYLRVKFENTINKVYAVFGDNAFRKINNDGSFDPRLNRAIMDCLMISFEHIEENKLFLKKEDIVELLRELPHKDEKFNDSISVGTSDKNKLEYRLTKWNEKLEEIIK